MSDLNKDEDKPKDETCYMKLLKPSYFQNNVRFLRCQMILNDCEFRSEVHGHVGMLSLAKYDVKKILFVSHRWLSDVNPDPEGVQFNKIKDLSYDGLVFYDFSSIPQRPRTHQEGEFFKFFLNEMQKFIVLYDVYVINSDDYFDRSWCLFEFTLGYNNIININEIEHPSVFKVLKKWLDINRDYEITRLNINEKFDSDFAEFDRYEERYDLYSGEDLKFAQSELVSKRNAFIAEHRDFDVNKVLKIFDDSLCTSGGDKDQIIILLRNLIK